MHILLQAGECRRSSVDGYCFLVYNCSISNSKRLQAECCKLVPITKISFRDGKHEGNRFVDFVLLKTVMCLVQLTINMHTINAVFLFGDAALNSLVSQVHGSKFV